MGLLLWATNYPVIKLSLTGHGLIKYEYHDSFTCIAQPYLYTLVPSQPGQFINKILYTMLLINFIDSRPIQAENNLSRKQGTRESC